MSKNINDGSSQQLISFSNTQLTQYQPRLDQDPVACYLARLAKRSKIAMSSTLGVVAKLVSNGQTDLYTFPWPSLRYQHVSALRAKLSEVYSPARANGCLAAIRGVVQECWQLGLITAEDFQKIKSVPAIKGERLPKGRALPSGEINALFADCNNGENLLDKRDTAILALLYGCGLRRSELVAIDLSDYDPIAESIHIRQGKGNKDRLVYVSSGVKIAIEKWLIVRGASTGAMFTRILKGNHLTDLRLSDQAVMLVLKTRADNAGVANCSPHDMRRTFISDLLDNGADISTVQKLAGHSSITTTSRYDRRGEVAKKKAVDLLHIPIK